MDTGDVDSERFFYHEARDRTEIERIGQSFLEDVLGEPGVKEAKITAIHGWPAIKNPPSEGRGVTIDPDNKPTPMVADRLSPPGSDTGVV